MDMKKLSVTKSEMIKFSNTISDKVSMTIDVFFVEYMKSCRIEDNKLRDVTTLRRKLRSRRRIEVFRDFK